MSTVVCVNGENITERMLESTLARYIIQLEEDEESDFEPTPDNMKYLKTEALNYLIERVLLLQLASQKELDADEKEVQDNILELKTNFESEEDWNNNMMMLHLTDDEMWEEIKKDIIMDKLLDNLFSEFEELSDDKLKEYFDNNRSTMKEPDVVTFYEFLVHSPGEVQSAAALLESGGGSEELKRKFEALGMELNYYVDMPVYRLPEQVVNVLTDLEEGKMGTMMLEDQDMVVYKLVKRVVGRMLEFNEIKSDLKQAMLDNARKDLYLRVVNEELDKAEIQYLDLSFIEKK